MSEPVEKGQPAPGSMQFDQAEYATPAVGAACAVCMQAVFESYFEVNGQLFCPSCTDALDEALTGGSGLRRFARAALFGLGGAVVGCGIYFAVLALTGYEVGLVSILVGLLVGGAVRKGCDGRGGWLYQALAMYLTYAAIVTTYASVFLMRGGAQQINAGDVQLPFAVVVILTWVFAHAAPFLGGADNLIGLVIIAIALYEAWKINQRPRFDIQGPFPVRGNKPSTLEPAP